MPNPGKNIGARKEVKLHYSYRATSTIQKKAEAIVSKRDLTLSAAISKILEAIVEGENSGKSILDMLIPPAKKKIK